MTSYEEKLLIKEDSSNIIRLQEAIKALSDDMKICQKSITDEKVLLGFNMAVALTNKHLTEREEENDKFWKI